MGLSAVRPHGADEHSCLAGRGRSGNAAHRAGTTPAVVPGGNAGVVRIKKPRRALAMSLDGNGRYCAADPREGAKLVVAEAARNVVCVGARPIAVTNCLNFASPERPEVMWSFSEVIDGMAEA